MGDAHASQLKAPTSPYQANDSKSQVTTIKLAKCRTAYLTYNLAAQATGYPSWFLTRARTDLGGSNRSTSSLRPTQGTWLQNSKRANLHLAIACPSNAQIWYTRDHGAAGSQNASAAEADRIRRGATRSTRVETPWSQGGGDAEARSTHREGVDVVVVVAAVLPRHRLAAASSSGVGWWPTAAALVAYCSLPRCLRVRGKRNEGGRPLRNSFCMTGGVN